MSDVGDKDLDYDFLSISTVDEVQQAPRRSLSQDSSVYAGRAGPYRGEECILPGTLMEQVLRRKTFEKNRWPLEKPTPDQLSEAGFAYEGNGDTVRCQYCDGTLWNWEPDDIPKVEHKRWFPDCAFVKLLKMDVATGTDGTKRCPF